MADRLEQKGRRRNVHFDPTLSLCISFSLPIICQTSLIIRKKNTPPFKNKKKKDLKKKKASVVAANNNKYTNWAASPHSPVKFLLILRHFLLLLHRSNLFSFMWNFQIKGIKKKKIPLKKKKKKLSESERKKEREREKSQFLL